MTTKAQHSEAAEALERLRGWLSPGDTVYCVLRSVSKSGMSRVIDFKKIDGEQVLTFSFNIAKALGMPFDRDREGVKVSGAGMDMGFAVVYELGRLLFPAGYKCVGEKCQSNDHSNGDRDYSPHLHTDGGYALKYRWL